MKPSFTARAVAFVLLKTNLFKKGLNPDAGFARRQEKALATPSAPSARNRKACLVSSAVVRDRTIWTIAPRDAAPRANVLFWHGGAYVRQPTAAHWDFLTYMAARHRWRITAPLYPLAGREHADRVTAFAADCLHDWLAAVDDGPTVMVGDSAGGGLAAAAMMAARDRGQALPDRAILICPWLDVQMTHPDQVAIERRDPILTIAGLRNAGSIYAGPLPADDPRVSPLFGDWTGLPPMQVFAGGDDMLVTDARALHAKRGDMVYDERDGLMHDWPILFFPESREAQAAMARFASGT